MLATGSGSSATSSLAIQAYVSNVSGEHVEEPEDILSACLGVVYNYTAITHADAGSIFSYTHPGLSTHSGTNEVPSEEDAVLRLVSDPIKLTLRTPDTRARNWELHASSVWAASVLLADHIDEVDLENLLCISEPHEVGAKPNRRLEVLELGAGAGLPGLLVAKHLMKIEGSKRKDGRELKSWAVTLSDYPDDLLIETLRANVRGNGFDEANLAESSLDLGQVRVVPYVWGEDVSTLVPSRDGNTELESFDLIIAADTLWNAALHEAFARTLYLALRRTAEARIHLVAGLHTGRYALSGFIRTVHSLCLSEDFPTKAESNRQEPRLEIIRISEREVSGDGRREWSKDREGEDDADRRRWVVWIVLGWVDS